MKCCFRSYPASIAISDTAQAPTMFRHLIRNSGSKVLKCAAAATAALAGAGTLQAMADAEADTLSIEKLVCHRNVPPPRSPTVLVSCGSFNPLTIMHLRMFDLAVAALAERGCDVWGCYMSPVADAYGKQGLAPVHHRVEMCKLAAAGTDNVMVDTWEAAQPGYTRTLQVLRHVSSSLQAYMQPQATAESQQQQGSQDNTASSSTGAVHAHGLAAAAAAAANLTAKADHPVAKPPAGASISTSTSQDGSAAAAVAPQPRVMLLCGADLLATINKPGVWKDPDVLLQEHGIVCICRAGTDVESLFQHPNSVLGQHRDKVIVVQEPVQNVISSSMVRWLLAHASPVRYLVPDAVLGYIHQHGLYSTYTEGPGVLHV